MTPMEPSVPAHRNLLTVGLIVAALLALGLAFAWPAW